jgi:hypothetical protein
MDCFKVSFSVPHPQISALELNKHIKGVLLHNGFFMLEDLLPFRDSNFAKLQTGKFQQNSLLRSISVRPAA